MTNPELDQLFAACWCGDSPWEVLADWLVDRATETDSGLWLCDHQYISDREWFTRHEFRGCNDGVIVFACDWKRHQNSGELVTYLQDIGIEWYPSTVFSPSQFAEEFPQWIRQ